MALPTSLLKKPVDLSGDSPEDEEYKLDFKKSQADLKAALAARENQLFDPVLLALSQGFAAPTKTGGTGESLSNAAGLANTAAQAQQKGLMENAQMRMQLAQMGLEQGRKEKAQNMVSGLFNPKPAEGAPTVGAPAVGATAGAPAGAGALANQSAQPSAPPTGGMRSITGADIFKISQYDKDLGDALAKAVGVDRDRFKISQNGIVFDSGTEKYLNIPIPGQTQSKFDTPFGSFNMTPNEYAQLGQAMSNGKGKEWMDMWRQGKIDVAGQPVAGTVPSPAGTTPVGGRPTVADAETAAAAKKEEALATVKTRVAQTTEVKDAAKAAMTLIPLYERAGKLLKTQGIDEALGVFERPDFLAQLGAFLDDAVRIGPYAVNAPAIRKIVTNFATDPKVISALTELGQVEAMWQFAQRKGLGSGTSVSNFEQQMVNSMGPNFKDPKDAYTKKLEFMREKANFEQLLGKELYRTGLQYEDYVNSDDFDRIFLNYRNRLEKIGEVKVPSVGGAVNPAAGNDLRKKIGM